MTPPAARTVPVAPRPAVTAPFGRRQPRARRGGGPQLGAAGLAGLALALAAPVARGAVPRALPFYDSFEPPQTGFSNWTTTMVNGTNALVQSPERAWEGTQSLKFTYAGISTAVRAAAVVDFNASTTAVSVRLWLYVPTGTEAGMGIGTGVRIVRVGDAVTSGGTGGASRIRLGLRRAAAAPNPLFLQVSYDNASGTASAYGTATDARITEGTWHYVELTFQPSVPRLRLFIDDPVVPRVDATPTDMVTYALWTCWVGLANGAVAQTAPLSLYVDNVAVAASQTSTRQSTPQHFNEIESGTLTISQAPPGKASSIAVAAGVGIAAATAAAHRGTYGVRLTDADGSVGSGAGSYQTGNIAPPPSGGLVYRRMWWRPTSTNGIGSRVIADIAGPFSPFGCNAVLPFAEVVVHGDGTVKLGGYDTWCQYALETSTVKASTNAWHLVELAILNAGSWPAERKLYLDGTLIASTGSIDWIGWGDRPDRWSDGQPRSNDRSWQGTDDFDDIRTSRAMMPSKLVTIVPASMGSGLCSSVIQVQARDSVGNPTGVPEPTLASLTASGVTGSFYGNASCTAATGAVPIGVGTHTASVYFKPTSGGTASLAATNVDYLSVPASAAVAGAAAPSELAFTTAGQSLTAGNCSGVTTLQTRDAAGNSSSVGSITSVNLASSSTGNAFYLDASCGTSTASVIVPAGGNAASFYFKDTKAGTPTITASATGLTSAAQAQRINPAAPSRLVFLTGPPTVAVGNCSAAVTLQSQDAFGNPSDVGAVTAVALASTSAGGTFYSDAACSTVVGGVSLPTAGNTARFHFKDTRAGNPTLTASAFGLADGTAGVTVTAGPLAALTVRGFPSPVVAGTAGSFWVAAVDGYGNPVDGYSGTVAFASTDPRAALPSPYTFSGADGGAMAFSGVLETAGGQAIEAADLADATLRGRQIGIEVLPAAASALSVSGIPSPIDVGAPADLSVEARDRFGNLATGYGSTVAFSSSDPLADLPGAAAFSAADAGRKSFADGVRFASAGIHAVVARDARDPAIAGAQSGIVVRGDVSPRIVRDANLRAAVGAPYGYNARGAVTAYGGLPLSYGECAGRADFRVDSATGAVRWTPPSAGSLPVCVLARNAVGEDRYPYAVDVTNRAPTAVTAVFSAVPSEGPAGLEVQFDASASTAAAMPLWFRWQFGDGSPQAFGARIAHRYLLPGGYRVRLTAVDPFGNVGQAEGSIGVRDPAGNHPPRARIAASPTRGQDALSVQFECDCRHGTAPLAALAWDLGNGQTSAEDRPRGTYGPGRYFASLVVVDQAGLSASDEVEIVVTRGGSEPPECRAAVQPPAGEVPLQVIWKGTLAPGSAAIVRHSWVFGPDDGVVGQSEVPRRYPDPGRYFGRLEVVDADGLDCEDVATAVAARAGSPEPPWIATVPPQTARCGEPYRHPQPGRAVAAGAQPVRWSSGDVVPEGFRVDPESGEIAWTPRPDQRGPQRVSIVAANQGGNDRQEFVIDVTCPNTLAYSAQSCGCGASGPAFSIWGLAAIATLRARRQRGSSAWPG